MHGRWKKGCYPGNLKGFMRPRHRWRGDIKVNLKELDC